MFDCTHRDKIVNYPHQHRGTHPLIVNLIRNLPGLFNITSSRRDARQIWQALLKVTDSFCNFLGLLE